MGLSQFYTKITTFEFSKSGKTSPSRFKLIKPSIGPSLKLIQTIANSFFVYLAKAKT